jgi:hypothetical protein
MYITEEKTPKPRAEGIKGKIVPIVKDDKSIRICADYKVTVNQAAKLDNYPIPKAEDLFATLSGEEKFIKLDMSQAYWQILFEDE